MFYKILCDGKIVDACTVLNYVKWVDRNQIFVSCTASDADGIVSSDGSEIYLFETADMSGDYKYVSYAEITEDVYYEILEELEKGKPIDDDPEPNPDIEPVVKDELIERLESLEEMNDILTECILEMSEIIYAE